MSERDVVLPEARMVELEDSEIIERQLSKALEAAEADSDMAKTEAVRLRLELGEAHGELERRTAWSNEQIAQRDERIAELERSVTSECGLRVAATDAAYELQVANAALTEENHELIAQIAELRDRARGRDRMIGHAADLMARMENYLDEVDRPKGKLEADIDLWLAHPTVIEARKGGG